MSYTFLTIISIKILFGTIPEALGVFVFGGGLVALAVTMRRILGKTVIENRENLEKTVG